MSDHQVEEKPRSDVSRATDGPAVAPAPARPAPTKLLWAVVAMVVVAGAGRLFLSQHDAGGPTQAVAQQGAAGRSQAEGAMVPPRRAVKPSQGAPTVPGPSAAGMPTTTSPSKAKKRPVVLGSDVAFGKESARVSRAARAAILRLAREARAAGLGGTVLVEGYTDNRGSAVYGRQLSQRRADAVAIILSNHLRGTPLRVVAVGRGESHPIRSNATAAGRAANRRVTIKLPSP